MADDLQTIVELLNAPPFNKNLTLLAFHEKKPLELLQVLNDILAVLDPKQAIDVRDEVEDATATRMIDFILALNYKPNMDIVDLSTGLKEGNQRIVYPILLWLLTGLSALKERAYVARFLRNLDVPEEFFADEVLVRFYEQYKTLQQKFKELHKAVVKNRKIRPDPVQLQKEIRQLETEREQLTSKIESFKERVEADATYHQVDLDELLNAVRALRKENEEEARLKDSLDEQKHLYFRSEQKHRQIAQELEDAKDSAQRDPRELVTKLKDRVRADQEYLSTKLVAELNDKEDMLMSLERSLKDQPMSSNDVADLEDEIRAIQSDVDALTRERDRVQSTADSQIGFFRDRANALEKKRDSLLERVEELQQDKAEVERELKGLDNRLEEMGKSNRLLTDKQLEEYMKQMQRKKEQYKTMKEDLEMVSSEVNILMDTERILRSRDQNIDEFNAQLEEQRGISGAMQTQDTIEKVSAMKSDVDAQKGMALDAMAQRVQALHEKLLAKKADLGPVLKRFELVRREKEAVQAEYDKLKGSFSSVQLSLEAELSRMEEQVQSAQSRYSKAESTYHFLNMMNNVTNAKVELVAQEQQAASSGGASMANAIAAEVQKQATKSKTLRDNLLQMKRTHEKDVEQRHLYSDLKKLMLAKFKIQKEAANQQRADMSIAEEAESLYDNQQGMGANVMVL